jgi:hypothetical protein
LSPVNSNEKSPAHENHIEKNTLNRDLAGIIQKYEKHEIQQNSKLSENASKMINKNPFTISVDEETEYIDKVEKYTPLFDSADQKILNDYVQESTVTLENSFT